MKKSEIYAALLDISEPSYYRWKIKHKLLMDLLESCFSDEELKQYIKNGDIPYYIKHKYKQFEKDAFLYVDFICNAQKSQLYFEFFYDFTKSSSTYFYSTDFKKYLFDKAIDKVIDKNEYLEFDFDVLRKLEGFINVNLESNWSVFNNILAEEGFNNEIVKSVWMVKLHKILFLSAQKKVFADLFYCYDRQNKFINDLAIVPDAPELNIYSERSSRIYQNYNELISQVLEKLEKNDLDFTSFKRYHLMEENEFTLGRKNEITTTRYLIV